MIVKWSCLIMLIGRAEPVIIVQNGVSVFPLCGNTRTNRKAKSSARIAVALCAIGGSSDAVQKTISIVLVYRHCFSPDAHRMLQAANGRRSNHHGRRAVSVRIQGGTQGDRTGTTPCEEANRGGTVGFRYRSLRNSAFTLTRLNHPGGLASKPLVR